MPSLRVIVVGMIALLLAGCAGIHTRPSGAPTPSSVNPFTGTRGGER